MWIRNERMDFIAGNALGRAVYAPVMDDPSSQGGNNALFAFLSPAARNYYTDWDKGADAIVATLRLAAGRNPRDKGLSDLIGELVTRSEEFSRRWASHNVRFHQTGVKRLRHPLVGDLELAYEAMQLPDSPGWTMFAFTAEPGTPSDERLKTARQPHRRRADSKHRSGRDRAALMDRRAFLRTGLGVTAAAVLAGCAPGHHGERR